MDFYIGLSIFFVGLFVGMALGYMLAVWVKETQQTTNCMPPTGDQSPRDPPFTPPVAPPVPLAEPTAKESADAEDKSVSMMLNEYDSGVKDERKRAAEIAWQYQYELSGGTSIGVAIQSGEQPKPRSEWVARHRHGDPNRGNGPEAFHG